MGKCPVCSTPTPDDFGLHECTGCGAQLILHIDGRVEHSSGKAAPDPVFNYAATKTAAPELEPEPSQTDDLPELPPPPAAGPSDSPDLSDIAQFGNSDASSSRDGSLRYNLYISGIDTSDVRESFREAITDRKLVWDSEKILRSVRNGEVRIPAISAVKAHILVTRLRNLPVQVRWEQYAVAQT